VVVRPMGRDETPDWLSYKTRRKAELRKAEKALRIDRHGVCLTTGFLVGACGAPETLTG
jgi:hypothetical protein